MAKPKKIDPETGDKSNPLHASERQRLVAQNAEIATLAGGLAHEIRNPLSTIGINLELLSEDISATESPQQHRMLRKIELVRGECRHLEDILNAFLQFVRVGELHLESIDLNDEITRFIQFQQPQASRHGIEISPHLASDLPPVMLDKALIKQAWLNLVQNAFQAMPEGGLLEFQTGLRNGWIEMRLIDNGTGMPENIRESMFQTFFSTKTGGSGLGLPTVRRIVESHGGTISCESEPGRGTRFTISLRPANLTDDE